MRKLPQVKSGSYRVTVTSAKMKGKEVQLEFRILEPENLSHPRKPNHVRTEIAFANKLEREEPRFRKIVDLVGAAQQYAFAFARGRKKKKPGMPGLVAALRIWGEFH